MIYLEAFHQIRIIKMNDLKVWVVPMISFCCFLVFISIFFLHAIGEIKFSRDVTYPEIQQNQEVVTIEEFQKAMSSSLKR